MIQEKMDQFNSLVDKHSILMGVNKDEGSKALMYFLPRSFPNKELERETMKKDVFDDAISKISKNGMVCYDMCLMYDIHYIC